MERDEPYILLSRFERTPVDSDPRTLVLVTAFHDEQSQALHATQLVREYLRENRAVKDMYAIDPKREPWSQPTPFDTRPATFFRFTPMKSVPGFAKQLEETIGIACDGIPQQYDTLSDALLGAEEWLRLLKEENEASICETLRYDQLIREQRHKVLSATKAHREKHTDLLDTIVNNITLDRALEETRALFPSTSNDFHTLQSTCYNQKYPFPFVMHEIREYFDRI